MKHKKMVKLRTKFFLILTCVVVLITSSMVFVGVMIYKDAIIKRYNEMGYQTADAVSRYFTEDELMAYKKAAVEHLQSNADRNRANFIMQSDRYKELQSLLDNMRDSMGANDINLCTFDFDMLMNYDAELDAKNQWNPLIYIMDSYYNPDYQLSMGDCGPIFPEFSEDIIQSYLTGVHSSNYFQASGSFGYTTTALLPITIEGKTQLFVAVEIPMSTLRSDTLSFILKISCVSGAAALFLLIAVLLFLDKTVVSPIKLLSNEALSFVSNDNVVSDKLGFIKTRDEIQTLSESLLTLEQEINTYIENLTAVTAEKERIGAELNVATKIQADMLPRIFPSFSDRKDFDIFASMQPAKEVGGDFYDFFFVDEDHLAMVMADVSGKGVPAALFMVIAKTLIKNRAQMGDSPSQVLRNVNEQLCEGNEAELFVTVWLAIIDLKTGKGKSVNAGHEHPVICRKGGRYELVEYRHSPAVATIEGIRFKEREFELEPGDRLFVYTDGVPEATNADNVLYGSDRMLEALNQDLEAEPEQLLLNVKHSVDEFVGDAPQFDDLTMMGFTYFGREEQ